MAVQNKNQYKKGFTVIGVLVVSAIGLSLMMNLSQMFANIHAQLRQKEQRSQQDFLNHFIGSQLKTGCTNTLKSSDNRRIIQGNEVFFSKIKDEEDHVILDLTAQSLELKAKYGIIGNTYFQLRCNSPSCKCVGESSPCDRKWTLSFTSQSELNGLPVYNKNFFVDLMVKYPLTSSRILTSGDKDKLSCTVLGITYSAAPPPSSLDCIRTDKTKNLALVGCGTTTQITESGTTAYGYNAGSDRSTGLNNTFIGNRAGESNTTGSENTFIGGGAGRENITGRGNIFLGFLSGQNNQGGHGNTFLGKRAGELNTSQSGNTFVGSTAGGGNRGENNTFIGRRAGRMTSGSNNTFIGFDVGYDNTTGHDNIFIGSAAARDNTTGHTNIFIGRRSGFKTKVSRENIFIGNEVGYGGYSRLVNNYQNIFIGHQAGYSNISGNKNIFIGSEAGKDNSSGSENVFIGQQAGQSNTTRSGNTFIGNHAGWSNSTGKWNTFIGAWAGKKNNTGSENTFVGRRAGLENISGNSNTFLGPWAGEKNRTGSENTFVGERAGKSNSIGEGNTFLGFRAGVKNRIGNENTFIGNHAGAENEKGSGNIFIGFHAADINLSYERADNKFVIGNDSRVAPTPLLPSSREWIVGDIGTDTFKINDKQICFVGLSCPSSSSRVLKKNIQPYKSFDEALEDILKTPLFTYEYKKDHPEKSRMGIIAEELPPHLRLKDKKGLAYPDWPSIYGTFWAGIKALHEMIVDLKQDISSKQQALDSRRKQLENRMKRFENKQAQLNRELSAEIKPSAKALVQSLKHFKKEVFLKFKTMDQAFQAFKEDLSLKLKALTSHVENLRKQLENQIQEFSQFRTKWLDWKEHLLSVDKGLAGQAENLSKELARAKARQSESKKQLEQNRRELAEVEKALDQDHKEIQALKKQLQSLIKNSQ